LQCFTIDFPKGVSASEGAVEDFPFAMHAAKHLDVALNVIRVEPEMVLDFEKLVYQLDEPQADPAALNALLICQMAHQHGLKVLLSGAGGDDIFGGYRRHWALMAEHAWSWLPHAARARLQAASQRLPSSSALFRRLSKAFRHAEYSGDRRIASYFLWIDTKTLKGLCGPALEGSVKDFDPLEPMLETLGELPPQVPALNRMLALDASYFLTDHNLNYTDKMSMAMSVEVRVPLLDLEMVRFAASLPPAFKQRGWIGKWIFKRAMETLLPRDLVYRPKTGFGVPLRAWMHGALREQVDEALAEATLRRRGLFDPRMVRQLIRWDREKRIDASYPILALICIETWCRLFLDGSSSP
jgi:asparagine synthase (glutamine-hydrolysing)